MFQIFLTVFGLAAFEIISSVDNAVINAEVLATMGAKARRWFLLWGLLFAVVIVRGLLPWAIVWAALPRLGPIKALTASFSGDPQVQAAVAGAAPVLLLGGGTFLLLLFLHWLLLEVKNYGFRFERPVTRYGAWFPAVAALLLVLLGKMGLDRQPAMALSAAAGSAAFFIAHGFRRNAEAAEKSLLGGRAGDISKILYLEVIDASFSVDGVLGAFAFTLSVPLILLGNGIGAVVLRELAVRNIERISRYPYLKNGAMYAIFGLGAVMCLHAFGAHVPQWVTPLITFAAIGWFGWRSVQEAGLRPATAGA